MAWRREAWKEEALDDLPCESAIVSQTNAAIVSKATSDRRGGAPMGFFERIDTELNLTH